MAKTVPVGGVSLQNDTSAISDKDDAVSSLIRQASCVLISTILVFHEVLLSDNLTGWPWIERLLTSHDRGWVEGYYQDIDSLLVFVREKLT